MLFCFLIPYITGGIFLFVFNLCTFSRVCDVSGCSTCNLLLIFFLTDDQAYFHLIRKIPDNGQ
ncbi:MAG TPA: hypothetical protein DF409_12800 [Bacteroidales bacterium]|nr:hypothetical protein [Bacteroidales bacterium]